MRRKREKNNKSESNFKPPLPGNFNVKLAVLGFAVFWYAYKVD